MELKALIWVTRLCGSYNTGQAEISADVLTSIEAALLTPARITKVSLFSSNVYKARLAQKYGMQSNNERYKTNKIII